MANNKKEEYKSKPVDFILCITVLLLLSLGIIMVLSASSPSSFSETGNSYTYVKKQAISAVIGLVAMFIISKIDYRIYKHFYKIAYIGSILLLAAVPIIGTEARRSKKMDRFRIYIISAFRTCKNWIYSILCSISKSEQR